MAAALGFFVKDFADASPFERDEHDAYTRWLTDNKEGIDLKKQSRKSVGTPVSSPLGSENVSRVVSVVTFDISIVEGSTDEDEEEGAGAGSP